MDQCRLMESYQSSHKRKNFKKINLNIYETANGILKIAIGNMVRAVKSVTTYQGKIQGVIL